MDDFDSLAQEGAEEEPFESAEVSIMQAAVRRASKDSPERERFVLEQRFAFNGWKPKTLGEVAELSELSGITRERVRQIQLTAQHKLRQHFDFKDPKVQGRTKTIYKSAPDSLTLPSLLE